MILEDRTCEFFTPLEVQTLNGLYPELDEWWAYWYSLSDEIEDRWGLVAAEGMRWLHAIQQRPYQVNDYQWWVMDRVEMVSRRYVLGNYLPRQFGPVCAGPPEDTNRDDNDRIVFVKPSTGLNAFLNCWCSLPDSVRRQLQAEWTQPEGAAK